MKAIAVVSNGKGPGYVVHALNGGGVVQHALPSAACNHMGLRVHVEIVTNGPEIRGGPPSQIRRPYQSIIYI